MGNIKHDMLEFSSHIWELPPFPTLLRACIALTIQGEDTINQKTIYMSMSPMLETKSYCSTYAFGNHIHVVSAEEHLTISDSGATTTFEHVCVLGPNDQRLVVANLEYVGWVKEILELNYGCYYVNGLKQIIMEVMQL
jgi:hypothetical protein